MASAYKNRTRAPGSEAPEAVYRRRMEEHARELAELDRRDRALVAGRLTGFLVAAGCLIAAVAGTSTPRTGWLVAAGVAFALFVVLVVLDSRLRRRIEEADALRAVYERALARHARDWPILEAMLRTLGLPEGPPRLPEAAAGEAFVRDLHLFGRASLYRLAATPGTPSGRRRLAAWLAAPAEDPGQDEVAVIRARQAAVRALAPELDWRAGLEAVTWGSPRRRDGAPEDEGGARKPSGTGDQEPVLDRFYAWLESEPYLLRRLWLMAVAWILTIAVPGSLALWMFTDFPAVWLPLGGVAYLLSAVFVPRMHEAYDRATVGLDGLRGHGAIFRRLEDLPGDAPMLDDLRERLASEGHSVADWMDRLDRLIVLSDTRRGMIYFFVQVLFLWDFHVELRLERWRAATGEAARGWLEALGEVEALAALAALAHGQPEWAFPEVDPEADTFEGEGVGHPLIPDERRVGNDVTVGPPGTFLLVTGSNMSGKTTLLRAVGANAVLARAGAPVCARTLRLPPVELATSVAVEDSLEEGVSFFLAELLRLKAVVSKAEAAAAENVSAKAEEGGRGTEVRAEEGGTGNEVAAAAQNRSRRVLYLLDEVLRGTNSAERRVAVGRVIGRLLAVGAIGAVTTHDLEMLAEGALETAAVPIHFRETVAPRPGGGADMTFDYRARPGLATTTNALRLLEAVGLAPGARPEQAPHEPTDGEEGST